MSDKTQDPIPSPAPSDHGDAPPAALPADPAEFRRSLWTAASELIVDIGYTFRGHFINGQKLRADAKWLGIPRVVFPVAASAGTASFAFFGWTGAAVIFGFGAAIVIALEKHFDPIGSANAHTGKGDRLLGVYKDLRYFRNVTLRSGAPVHDLERTLNGVRKRADDLRMLEPRQIPAWAYAEARRQIADGQSEYEKDALWQEPPADL